MLHLHDSVQTDLKRLLRNPPLVNVPTITDLISVHPLLGALPSMVREALEGSMNEMMKPCGVPLYKEGSNPNGIWLISSGVVKWTSKSITSRHSLHPTFTHGSTLGLYELLVGKRCLCDIITNSVVLCFFIESEIIFSVLESNPAVEDFLWKESAIVLAKLLLPRVFENMSTHELRVLVAERSEITVYMPGGNYRVLLPLQGDQSSQNMEISGSHAASFSHQGSQYQVPARARVIFFDIAAFEVNGALRRRSPSLPSLLNRPLTREHGGLMSWPENFYRPGECEPNFEGTYRPSNSLSARAMQLGIFGSMVDVPRRDHSFPASK
ncbi:hypothetical protein OIU84_018990 [Salix udensis]|uniref:Cyclic nucleotide-binding domain-containing protein n=1 Tax=Salix udensis TaxID=889485 RepID=A0AAD6KXS3_9ROSI|nr:hypothetical protein OIU84_018990 [Salix udensis]